MTKKSAIEIAKDHISPFERIKRTNDTGNEYWSSRNFAKILDYSNYRNFEQVISKARTACINSGLRIEDHFVDGTDMIELANSLKRQMNTILLSRYACYLVVQNADPRKENVALGQSYFAIQTRKQEQDKSSIKSIIKSVYCIYDVLRGISSLQSPRHISLVFVLLFYKRISDTSLLNIPTGCNWSDVSTSEKDNKLTLIVDSLRRILSNYNDPGKDLYAVLNSLDIYNVCWNIDAATQRTIFNIVDELDLSFSEFDYFEFDSAISNVLEDAIKSDRRYGGEFFNPAWLEELLVKMLAPKSREIISFPFCKAASVISAFVKAAQTPSNIHNNPTISLNIQGMEINQLMWAFAKLRLTLLGGVALDIINANPFEVQPKLPSDVVCFIPPFAYMQKGTPASCFIGKEKVDVPRSSGEVRFLLDALQQTSKTGRIGVVVPINFLFNHSFRKVRRALLEEDYLDAVIELPDKCFTPSTSIKTVLLVLNKAKSPERQHTVALGITPGLNKKGDLSPTDLEAMVAGYRSNISSSKWVFATMEEIQSQDYNLTPSYFHNGLNDELDALLQNKNGKRLDEICQVARGKARKPLEDSTGLPFITTKDLSGEVTDPYLDFSHVTQSKPEAPNQIITQKCILVSLIGRVPKATIYDPERAYKPEENEVYDGIIINQNIACLVPKEEIVDFEYLYYQLNAPLFTKQFDNLHGGVGIPNISLSDLNSIIIPVMEQIKQQRETTRQIKGALYKEANAKLEVLKTKLNIEEEKQEAEYQVVRHLAHDLSPKLYNVDSVLKHLTSFIVSHELLQEPLQEPLQEQFDEGQPFESVGEAIDKARSDISQMHKLIKDTRKVITEEIPIEEFSSVNLRDYLETIKKKYANGNITLDIDCDQDIFYEMHETSFAEMIDNFVRNAEVHGFENGGKLTERKIAIVVTKRKNDPNLIIEIKNNGNPLPDELTMEKFIGFGNRGKNSPGDGLGGAYIYKVIRAHRGTLEIIRDDKEYPVNFRITLPYPEGINEQE